VLARLPGPLALLEVGASAGLCLLPDRYAYDYGAGVIGDRASPVLLSCEPHGPVPLPRGLPQVVWRRGIDLDPIDLTDTESVRWLECCIWPGQPERLARLRAAIQIAGMEPPTLIRGDLLDLVADVAREAPAEATLVTFHSAVLAYLSIAGRREFMTIMARLPAVWISNEAPGLVGSLSAADHTPAVAGRDYFIVGQGPDRAVALADPHGVWIEWLPA
jgi:hypothetical protein